ncbi:RNA dependent RNA polymerase-domain-containing protein [Mycena rebaudengoi]|nr:RNA dependent RNA polymerase-domain-containing protein [Mycena rebaudengoi]
MSTPQLSSSQGTPSTEDDDELKLWSPFGPDDEWSDFPSSSPPDSGLPPSSSPQDNGNSYPTRSSTKRKLEESSPSPESVSTKKMKTQEHEDKEITFESTVPKAGDTSPVIIARCNEPELMASTSLSYGARWEIARLVSMGRLKNATLADLYKLRGRNAEAAARTAEVLMKHVQASVRDAASEAAFTAEKQSQDPWGILDAEEDALRVNPNAALGNSPDYPDGYGGKLCFGGKISIVANSQAITLELDRCTVGSSCRLWRRFGSSSFLRIKVPSTILHSSHRLTEYFQRPFVLWDDSVFRAFYAKEDSVFLFKTRELPVWDENGRIRFLESPNGLSLFEFIDQFNPLHLNDNQILCKWASRFALGLSNSVPGPVLSDVDVEEIPDKISSSKSDMTDGCGVSNLAFNLKLRRDLKLESTPCAVQIRHGGKKGMLTMWPQYGTNDEHPKIAVRPSQIKIQYSPEAKAHPANATIDILRVSRTKTPARISPEVIVNLEDNGVPAKVFVAMQNAYIEQGIEGMIAWAKEEDGDKPEAMFRLWSAVEKSEGVYMARRVREVAGEARFRGYGERYGEVEEEDDDDEPGVFDKAVQARSTAWWPDYISGCPSTLAETVMALLDAGFTPQALPVLRDKLKQIVRYKIKYRSQHFKYEVAHSGSAFVVPDFMGVLAKDEIHFKSSRRVFQTADGLETDTVLGDVLMTRNPCKVPTDVRKVKAVKHAELSELVDVIVCSVQGERRLLDFLAGGDYDGDTAIVIWDAEIVASFKNADEKFSVEPRGVSACFTRDETTVAKFNADNVGVAPEVKAARLQKYLLGFLRDPSAVGHYSMFHDNAILTKGYSNPRTVKLAYQFCKILDSPKTGYTIRKETRTADSAAYGHARGPEWKDRMNKRTAYGSAMNAGFLKRTLTAANSGLARPFIMDVLDQAAAHQENQWLKTIEELFLRADRAAPVLDPALVQPWDDYERFAEERRVLGDTAPRMDLSIICQHVKSMSWKRVLSHKSNGHKAFTDRAIETRQDTLRALSKEFQAYPTVAQMKTIADPALIARLRASYAYKYDHEVNSNRGTGWSRFPWDMALGDLCRIKATALGSHKAVTNRFYEHFRIGGDRR